MFEIPVGDLLSSYSGDSKELEFRGPVFDGYYDDLRFTKDLHLKLKLIGLDDGVDLIIEILDAEVEYEGAIKKIHLEKIERMFKEKFELKNPDDIKYINMKNTTIDLKDVLREEILMQCM